MSGSTIASEQAIRDFWYAHPCGDHQVESLKGDYEAFFERYDQFRYSREGHILRRLDAIDFKESASSKLALDKARIPSRSFGAARYGPGWI